jgi:TetR/AcrR family transcriptional regulator, transcriptional repressor for nem operon
LSKGEETRQRIIVEAASLFNQRGYEGCSIQDIMNATGLEKGGIYRHFESKEELAAEAFDFAWATTIERRRQKLDSIPDHVSRLRQHIANFVTRAGIPGGCPLLNTAVYSGNGSGNGWEDGPANGNPVLRERVRAALHGWQRMLGQIVEDGKKAETIRVEVDACKLANLIIGTVEGAMLIGRIEGSDQPIRDALEHLNEYLETKVRRTSSDARPHLPR